jgi:hypothetical protein
MDAAEYFRTVVKPNYEQFIATPNDLRLLWNAVVSMNTIAEYVALDQLEYAAVPRHTLDNAAAAIRARNPILSDLKYCAETFKHVRKMSRDGLAPMSLVATSTAVSSGDQTTWQIGPHDLVTVLRQAFSTIKVFPELR